MSQEKAQALLFGLALGDAVGWPVEFMRLGSIKDIPGIKQKYGPGGIQEPPNPAIYTDDTQMTLALTEGLLQAGLNASVDEQMQAIGHWFVLWKNSKENNRAPGRACMAGIANYENSSSWREAGLPHSKGCGSAMRVATIGYFYQRDETRLRELAIASSMITHRHPTALAASVAGAYLVKLALDGIPPSEYMQRLLKFTDGMSDELDAAIYRIGHVLGWTDEERALNHLGEGWIGEQAIALALYCVLRYPDDYVACVRRAANTNGDSDSIACIAGGIMGARLGLKAIPSDWRERCENRDYITNLAYGMAKARGY